MRKATLEFARHLGFSVFFFLDEFGKMQIGGSGVISRGGVGCRKISRLSVSFLFV